MRKSIVTLRDGREARAGHHRPHAVRRFHQLHGFADDSGFYAVFLGALAMRRGGQGPDADALLADASQDASAAQALGQSCRRARTSRTFAARDAGT
jgi:hypothetical protein